MDRPTLSAALDSIAAQDYPHIEIVLVNALGQAHRPMPVHLGGLPMRTTPAGRATLPRAAAANAGLDAARGSLVTFLDDDDVYLGGHIGKLVAALQAQPDAVAAHSDVSLGQMGAQGWVSAHEFDSAFDAVRLRFENFLPIHAVLIRRAHSAAAAACRFDEAFDLFEDWDFWLQLAALGPFVHAPGVSARYVAAEHGGSGVFGDSAAAITARRRLFDKWRTRASADDHARLLEHAQVHWRLARQTRAQLDDCQAQTAVLQAMLQARDADLTQYAAQQAQLESTVFARDVEITDGQRLAADLRQILAARETEIADGQQLATDLRQILAAREIEITHARQHIDGLQDILLARDAELAGLNAQGPLAAFKRALKKKSP